MCSYINIMFPIIPRQKQRTIYYVKVCSTSCVHIYIFFECCAFGTVKRTIFSSKRQHGLDVPPTDVHTHPYHNVTHIDWNCAKISFDLFIQKMPEIFNSCDGFRRNFGFQFGRLLKMLNETCMFENYGSHIWKALFCWVVCVYHLDLYTVYGLI